MTQKARQTTLGIIALVIIAGAAGLYFARTRGQHRLPEEFHIVGPCLACGEEVEVIGTYGKMPPLVCPKCGERAVYEWMYCPKCKKLFVPDLIPSPEGDVLIPRPFPSCTGCGYGSPVAYDPTGVLEQEPTGHVPLPEWHGQPGG